MPRLRKKYFFVVLLFLILLGGSLFISQQVLAQGDAFGTGYLTGTNLPSDDLRVIVIRFINIGLGIVGTIFLLLIIYGGFLWMTARGNQPQIEKAQKVIISAVAGLLIIFLAFAITRFVFNILGDTTVGGGGPGSCTDGAVSGCSICVGGLWQYNPSLCPLPGSSFRIKDIETAHAGVSDSDEVYLCSSVQANFNNSIDPVTVTGNVRLTEGTTDIPADIVLTNRVIEIDPQSKLVAGKTYTAHYDQALSDTSGLFLSACDQFGCSLSGTEYTWKFVTGNLDDPDAPQVTSTFPIFDPANPAYPDRNVSRDSLIRVTFSEAVRASSIDDGTGHPLSSNIILEQLDAEGGSVVATIDSSQLVLVTRDNGFDMYLEAPNLFDPFAWYRVTVQNVQDLCGNVMNAPVIWEFQTNDRAPGIGNIYPTGTNVCPDVGGITAVFNTSMYYDVVSISISEGAAGNPPVFSAGMRPFDLDPGPYIVSVPGGTWSTDSASNYQVFTFTPSMSFKTNTDYFVNVTTGRVMDTDGNLLSSQWNFSVTDAASCTCEPVIFSINPSQGLAGQCVTITGSCFQGAVPGDPSDNRYAQISSITFDGVVATNGVSASNYVTTSVPDSFVESDRPLPQVAIQYINDASLGTLSTANVNVDFYVNAPGVSDGPCLLGITPPQACFDTKVRLTGERFGDDPGEGNRSTVSNNVVFSSGATQVPDDKIPFWSDPRIDVAIPSGVSDGSVYVTADGQVSNSIPFDLSCGVGVSCSSDPNVCSPDNSICGDGLSCNTATCSCEAVVPPGTPVVRSPFPSCSRSCPNAEIGADFSLDMNPGSISASTIDVYPCSDLENDPRCLTEFASELTYDTIDYDNDLKRITITPQGLGLNTTYRVVFTDQMKSSEGVALGGLNFDLDGDNARDSFSWTFTTKGSTCALAGVDISPPQITADRLGRVIRYNAYAEGSNKQCGNQLINRYAFDWSWASSLSSVAPVSSKDDNTDGRVDPIQNATSTSEGITYISTSSGTFSKDGELKVDVLTCDEETDCTKEGQCPGSVCDMDGEDATNTCIPVITALSPNSGPVSRWTTVQGCYFGSRQGSGSVMFDDTEAEFPACSGGTWSNDEIIVEVPTLSDGDYEVMVNTHRGLPSNTQTFTVGGQCLIADPVGYWSLDDGVGTTVADGSGNGHTGMLSSGVSWITGSDCVSGSCIRLDELGDELDIPSLYNTAFPQERGTLSMWVKRVSWVYGKTDALFDYYDDARDHILLSDHDFDTDNMHLAFQEASPGSVYNLSYTFPVSSNEWHHIVITWDTLADSGYIYVDGTLIGGSSISDPGWTPRQQVMKFGGNTFDGYLDDIRLYPYVRSAGQIWSEYITRGSGGVMGGAGAPGICRINPSSGNEGTSVAIDGVHFGSSADRSSFAVQSGRQDGDIVSWDDTRIRTLAPKDVVTGDIIVYANSCQSNGVEFEVTVGVDSPCDGNSVAPLCQPDDGLCGNGLGLFCDPNASCTCQKAPGPFASAYPDGPGQCRNVVPYIVFDQLMDTRTITTNTIQLSQGTPAQCTLYVTADDRYNIFFNGVYTGASVGQWKSSEQYALPIKPGEKNTIAIEAFDFGVIAGLLVQGEQCSVDGRFTTDTSWKYSTQRTNNWIDIGFDDSGWSSVTSYGGYSDPASPWCPGGGCVSGFPNPSSAEWVWSPNNTGGDTQLGFRYSFTGVSSQASGGLVPISLDVVTVSQGDLGCGNAAGCTVVYLKPLSPLSPQISYTVLIDQFVKSQYGVPFTSDVEFTDLFVTGDTICAIDHVDVLIDPPGVYAVQDYFLCAGRDDCPSDQSLDPGNQHRYRAQAYDASVPANSLIAEYTWSEADDRGNVYSMRTMGGDGSEVLITSEAKNGSGSLYVNAFDPTDSVQGSRFTNVSVDTFLCENPWPSLTTFPYTDTDTDFSLFYCRDRGTAKVCMSGSTVVSEGCVVDEDCGLGEQCRFDTRDDLPALDVVSSFGSTPDALKEFLFLPQDVSGDAISLIVYANSDFLSPSVWYTNSVPNPGSPQSVDVDGYEAVRDGRTVYVSAAQNVSSNQYVSNIYVISYNDNATPETRDIYDQLLQNWHFTTDLIDRYTCSGDTTKFCTTDQYCRDNGYGNVCYLDATKARRDTKRITDIGAMRTLLSQYRGTCSNDTFQGCLVDSDCTSGGVCKVKNATYPLFESGSFVPGMTTSRWNLNRDSSWIVFGNLLGMTLPVDPINEFSSCPDGYDPNTCWDETTFDFQCADYSRIYQYEVLDNGLDYRLYANMEVPNISWIGFGQAAVGGDCRSFGIGP